MLPKQCSGEVGSLQFILGITVQTGLKCLTEQCDAIRIRWYWRHKDYSRQYGAGE